MKHLFAFSVMLSAVACGNTSLKYKVVGPEDFSSMIRQADGSILLDIRTPEEVVDGMIPGAEHLDFYGEDFEEAIARIDKHKPVFIYCAKGGRSRQAVDIMKSMSFREVTELKGGYDAWSAKGFATTK